VQKGRVQGRVQALHCGAGCSTVQKGRVQGRVLQGAAG
jgi:hypothetical protein